MLKLLNILGITVRMFRDKVYHVFDEKNEKLEHLPFGPMFLQPRVKVIKFLINF